MPSKSLVPVPADLPEYRGCRLSAEVVVADIALFQGVVVPVLVRTQDGGPATLSATMGEGPSLLTGHDSRLVQVSLDVGRREVRDFLVRLGAPEIARTSAGAALMWWHRREPVDLLGPWSHLSQGGFARRGTTWIYAKNREERVEQDVRALLAGTVLEELEGWYVPCGARIGWLPRDAT